MEHRLGSRFRVGLPVQIRLGGRSLGWYTSRDISNGGIAINGNTGLARNSVVSLTIEVLKNDTVVTETARAVVVYRKQGLVGLMWITRGISLQRLALPVNASAAA